MEVTFAKPKLAKLCNSGAKLRGKYGPRMAALIQQRLFELSDAEVLDDLRHITGARCHELRGNLVGLLAVDLVHPFRLIFGVADDPRPAKDDGGLDWTQVRCVEVVDVADYH